MADPRLKVSFEEIDFVTASFIADGVTITYDRTLPGNSSAVGLAATLTGQTGGKCALAVDGDMVLGKVIQVDQDLVCTVQIEGGMTLPGGNGASLAVGAAIVGAIGPAAEKGRIRAAASGTAAELVKCRGFIIDGVTAPTACIVML